MKEKKENRFIVSVKVGPKGQITIPAEARKMFDIKEGDTLMVMGDIERGIALLKDDLFYQLMGSVGQHRLRRRQEALRHDQGRNRPFRGRGRVHHRAGAALVPDEQGGVPGPEGLRHSADGMFRRPALSLRWRPEPPPLWARPSP